ncbi:MAG: hypothetical protein EA341_12745 [Mongoliibacter sp.]|uniref:hypothetical protein n=1 Tax=Mongoliibacter sp. TaxID=2022438 RepID=UPI0012F40CF3|nr:hypothetical protein [Mongoliibacter sp.]TVP47428.1 MAG: hypothetical protein EA341_12745 [Mongoliibacter sp.]
MTRLLLVSLLLAIVIFQIQGEKIPIHEGAGWEGLSLRGISEGFMEHFDDEGYDAFLVHRILPFALVNMVFGLLEFDMDPESLLHGILILNFLFLLLGCYWYFRITKKLRSSTKMEILGFALMFGTFLVLKLSWYEPFSPALFAFVLGIGQVNYFVRYEKTKLFLVSLLGGFVWPSLFPIGMMLIFLPNDKVIFKEEKDKFQIPYLFPGLVLGVLVVLASRFYGTAVGVFDYLGIALGLGFLILLITLALTYSGIDWRRSMQLFQKKIKAERLTFLLISVASYFVVIYLLAVGKSDFSFQSFLIGHFLHPVQRPLVFLTSPFSFYGILIPLTLVFFSRISREVGKLGLGFTLVFLIMLMFGLYSDALWWTNVIPFLVLLILKGLRRYTLLTKDIWVLCVLNVLLSKAWYQINTDGLSEALVEHPQAFPAQRYLQHFGLLQSDGVYVVYLAVLLLVLGFIFLGKKRYAKAPSG